MDSDKPIVVVGAGIAGCFLALFLQRRGFTVRVFEKRPDFRVQESNDVDKYVHVTWRGDAASLPVLWQ